MRSLRNKIKEPKGKIVVTYLAVILAMLFWGFSFIWTKMLLEDLKPVTIIFLRLVISTGFLLLAGLVIKKLQKIEKKDFGLLLFLAFLEPFMYFLGETNGLNHVSATVSSVLIALIPLLSPFAAWLFYRENLTLLNFIGIFISFIGVTLVILKDDFTFNASAKGILLMTLAVVCAIGYSVVVIRAVRKYNIFTIITFQNMLGALYFLPLFFIFDYQDFVKVEMNIDIWIPLVGLAILASSLAFMLFTYGIKVLGIIKANTISNAIPVFTAVFAYFLLDERLTIINILGILIVLTGLLLSQLKKGLRVRHRIFWFKKVNDIKD
jgi:drug/metabolite transporter (DMT)-like permease